MPSSKCLIQNELDGIFEYFSSHNTLFRHFRLNGVLFLYYGTQFCIFIGLCMCAHICRCGCASVYACECDVGLYASIFVCVHVSVYVSCVFSLIVFS